MQLRYKSVVTKSVQVKSKTTEMLNKKLALEVMVVNFINGGGTTWTQLESPAPPTGFLSQLANDKLTRESPYTNKVNGTCLLNKNRVQ